jgi:hypothetical protein
LVTGAGAYGGDGAQFNTYLVKFFLDLMLKISNEQRAAFFNNSSKMNSP